MRYLRNTIDYKPWRMTLVFAVLFVAIVLGIVQRIASHQGNVDSIIEVPELVEAICEDTGGEWESCGSACRMEEVQEPDVLCAEVCVDYCHCRHDGECPEHHHCDEFIEDAGICVIDF